MFLSQTVLQITVKNSMSDHTTIFATIEDSQNYKKLHDPRKCEKSGNSNKNVNIFEGNIFIWLFPQELPTHLWILIGRH